jgi:hypothetical protein
MKTSKLILCLMILNVTCFVLLVPSVNGLDQNDISLMFDWEEDIYYRGDQGSVRITVDNDGTNRIKITWIGIHFAWQETDMYWLRDLENNPRDIFSGNFAIFTVGFEVATDATVGYNNYQVWIDYEELVGSNWDMESWQSNVAGSLRIHDTYEKTYLDINPTEKLTAINTAKNENYQSPEARALVVQAENAYLSAQSYANQGQYQDAITQLQTIPNLLAQAEAEEESYLGQQGFQSNLLLIAGLGIAVAVIVIFLIMRSRRPKPLDVQPQIAN